ncbi:hypothetical protein CTAYLR_006281 [Chrysophaeum taylorii]|uniref:DUF4200 domain-containing protein n=1 Tax=Chrysophaeum taylorii TaxID=2483200 RepID=A0AAD7XNL7_9STRA|nr:hypothetical protein CTAYLR_006281 [Chrysophaeum taylorii]
MTDSMAFVTQRAKTQHDFEDKVAQEKVAHETQALEAMVSGVNQISQSTLLLKKKKEMHEVDDALDFMKDEYKVRMEACEQRQRKFEKRQLDMKEQVTKFEKFIQENDSKRQRAELKAKQERRLLEQKEAELKRHMAEMETLETEREALLAHLDKLRKYKTYLEKTVESAEDETAEEIWDLLNRYTTLSNANVDLTDQVQRGDVEMDELRTKMENLKLHAQSTALVQSSQMNAKQKHLDVVRAETKKHDDLKFTQEERVKDVTRETAQIVNAVSNLYHRCLNTMRTRVSAVNTNDVTEPDEQIKKLCACLDLIGERLNDLDDIRASCADTNTQLSSHAR